MVTSELTGEVSMGVLLVFLVSWRRGRYIGSDQQGDNGTHKDLKKFIVNRLLPNEQFDFVNENNMKLR